MKNERRKHPRVSYPKEVFFKIGSAGNDQGRVTNLSLSGLYLRANKQFRMGRHALIYLPYMERKREVLCFLSGQIVYTKDHPEEGEIGYAIRLDATLPITTRKTLLKIVDEILSPKQEETALRA